MNVARCYSRFLHSLSGHNVSTECEEASSVYDQISSIPRRFELSRRPDHSRNGLSRSSSTSAFTGSSPSSRVITFLSDYDERGSHRECHQ